MTLPDGTTIAFTGYKEFAALQFSHDPGQVWVLGAAIALLAGLLGMLLLRRERVFARVAPAPDGGGTVLTRRLAHAGQRRERAAVRRPDRRPGAALRRTGAPRTRNRRTARVTPDPSLAALSDHLFSVTRRAVLAGRRRLLRAAGVRPPARAGPRAGRRRRARSTAAAEPAAEAGRGRRWGLVAMALTVLGAAHPRRRAGHPRAGRPTGCPGATCTSSRPRPCWSAVVAYVVLAVARAGAAAPRACSCWRPSSWPWC